MTTYDADVLRDNKEAYLNETFMGKPVEFSDDSLLTLFALKRGKVIQHPGVFSFSMMPERFSHHAKQQLRWMRGSFIRSIWRIRYLSVASWGFWRQLIGWVQGLATLIVSFTLLVFYPIFEHKIVWEYALVPFIVGYILALRYYGIRRSDMTFWQQTGIFLLGPIAWIYQASVLRFFRFYGAFTCRKTGWATRQNGAEVTLNKQQQAA
jgi:hyaluronan synthase